jgi:hypothetical protein
MIVLWIFLADCKTIENESSDSKTVVGTYVHTYTADVIDPETGEVMGSRTVKDTIFIREADENFEVSNHKWMDNDYDNESWILPESEADRAMPTYIVEYDTAAKKLIPSDDKKRVPLYVAADRIYWGDEKALEYMRVSEQ